MIQRTLPALLLGALLAGCAAEEPPSCRVETIADLPLLPHANLTAVAATLEGKKVALLIDTGAFVSSVTQNGAQLLGVHPRATHARYVKLQGIGGIVDAPLVTVHDLSLGRGLAKDLRLPIAGNFPQPIDGLPVVGLFGDDFLSNYDVDLDMPRQHFGLYKATGCDGAMRPFDPPYFEVPFREEGGQIILDIKLNDRPMPAILDTGASVTLIDRHEAVAAGVSLDGLKADEVRNSIGNDLHIIMERHHQFSSLEVGDERMNNFHFEVAAILTRRTLLGRDFLRFNHILISYPRRMLFIQPVVTSAAAR